MKIVRCNVCDHPIAYGDICNFCGNNVLHLFLTEEILWNPSVKKYVENINETLNAIDSSSLNPYFTDIDREVLRKFIMFCRKPELNIALIGTVKAGKSTLINSLLGHNIAPVDVNPETASLTKFKFANNSDYIKVSFYTNSEWNELIDSVEKSKSEQFFTEYNRLDADKEKNEWIDKMQIMKLVSREDLSSEIKKWVSSKSATHYFVKELEIGLIDYKLPEQIVLIDTPGLDDPVAYRSDITRMFIDQADAVLVCVRANALTVPELSIINGVFSNKRFNKNKIYVIGTQIYHYGLEWEKIKSVWLEILSRKSFYNSEELASKNIIGLSSQMYLLLQKVRSSKLDSEENFDLIAALAKLRVHRDEFFKRPEDFKWVFDFTNIEYLKDKLHKDIIANIDEIMLTEISNEYRRCAYYIIEVLKAVIDQQNDLLSLQDKDSKAREELLKEKSKELQYNLKQKESLLELSKSLEKNSNFIFAELFVEINKLMEEIL